jgi:S-formylglutathione hydrolase FrmB
VSELVQGAHSFYGRVEMRPFASEALRGNRAGDPHVREVPVWLPPGHDAGGARFPVVFMLAPYASRGHRYLDTDPWRPGVVALYDRAVARGEAPPAILVLPDAFTKLGGSQYVDSSYLGGYATYVARELVEWVDASYPTSGRRGVLGKSSGGFGALHLAMRFPGTFHAVASISGDCCFEIGYGPDLLACLRAFVPFGGDPARFLEDFLHLPDLSGDRHAAISVLALSAAYSPNPASPLGFDLPMDLATGERIEAVWQRWLAFDPLVDCEPRRDALAKLDLLHLECGLRDEYHLQWGLRRLARRLRELAIAFEHEEHDGGHRGIDERFLRALPRVIAALR